MVSVVLIVFWHWFLVTCMNILFKPAYFHILLFNLLSNALCLFLVSARLGLKPSAEPTLTKASNNKNNTFTAATTKPSIASPTTTNTGEGKLTLKDLQGVFSSSLVSAASLDFLRVNTVVTDDYADTK